MLACNLLFPQHKVCQHTIPTAQTPRSMRLQLSITTRAGSILPSIIMAKLLIACHTTWMELALEHPTLFVNVAWWWSERIWIKDPQWLQLLHECSLRSIWYSDARRLQQRLWPFIVADSKQGSRQQCSPFVVFLPVLCSAYHSIVSIRSSKVTVLEHNRAQVHTLPGHLVLRRGTGD